MSDKTNTPEPNVFELINVVTRQTDYDNDTALEKLQHHNYDPISVIRDFMGPQKVSENKVSDNKTLNQRVYHEMRTMLDTANATYRAKKEREEELEKQMEQNLQNKRQEHANKIQQIE